MDKSLQSYNRQQKLSIWAERVRACRASGQTVTQWCEENSISVKTYYNWQKRIYEMVSTQEPQFAVISIYKMRGIGTIATVQIGDGQAEIHSGADVETLTALFLAMKSC